MENDCHAYIAYIYYIPFILPYSNPMGAQDNFAVPVEDFDTATKVHRAIAAIRGLLQAGRPLVVAYSAGKDSSVMMSLVLEAALEARALGCELPTILVTHGNTGIENPAYAQIAYSEIEKIRVYAKEHALPVRVDITLPALNDTWAVRVLSGRALPTFANSASRDCSVSWKIKPQERKRKEVLRELSAAGRPVVLIGTRYEESPERARRMAERGETDIDVWREEVADAGGKILRTEDRLSPIAFWTQEDVWVFLSDLVHGRRRSFTDAVAVWEAYQDGGNASCAVVGDDAMKSSAKACGARFGCALCTAVGRDKSLENMLEADPKYAYLRNLNRLQRFLVDTQYDLDRRNWLGRTINAGGYVAIAPDTYSPAMLRELLTYALSIDAAEVAAAVALRIKPRFQLVSPAQLLAIDAIWSAQGIFPRPFEAIRVFVEVNEQQRLAFPPDVDTAALPKAMPAPRYLHVGNEWDSEAGQGGYTGLRSLSADLAGAFESGCVGTRTLASGRTVIDMESSSMFDVDEEGAISFLVFEADRKIAEYEHVNDATAGYRYYAMLGVLSTSARHVGVIDEVMRRTYWKERNGLIGVGRETLLARSVSAAEARSQACPEGAAR